MNEDVLDPKYRKYCFIFDLAKRLVDSKLSMSCSQLVCVLNANNYRTSYGTEYDPNGRGIYRVIRSVYYFAMHELERKDYDVVANAFTKPNGEYAWKE